MNIVHNNELTFQQTALHPVSHAGETWLTSSELAAALGYKKSDAVTQIYSRYHDEFTETMSTTLKMSVVRKTGVVDIPVRVFSLRGAHLIAMFATTAKAKEFRRWVLDILDRETGRPTLQPTAPAVTQEEKDAYNINALVKHFKFMLDAWRHQIEPALRTLESPLPGRLNSRFSDGYVFLRYVEKSLNEKLHPGQSARLR